MKLHYTYFIRILQGVVFAIILILFNFSSFAQDVPRPEPEIGTGLQAKEAARGLSYMVVTAHPEATKIGEAILSKGGTAADAALAIQMVLGLVEPQSSGLGGGAFALYYDAKKGQLVSLDGREAAPALASRYLFRGDDGKPMDFMEAVVGGRAVGVPGTLALLEKLHGWYGSQNWASLFQPAIQMADNGFTVTPRLSQMVAEDKAYLTTYTDTKLYFFPDVVTPVQAGEVLRNPKYAVTLRQIAQSGAEIFYKGDIAEEIVRTVREEAPDNPGLMTMEDMAAYKAKERPPVCGGYRGYKICSMGEPSSGGLTLIQILGLLERFNLKALGPQSPVSWHLIGEASRLAFADRNYYMADPDFVKTPGKALIDPAYLRARSALLSPDKALDKAVRGIPPGWTEEEEKQPSIYDGRPGTSHISIVDMYGNILSMTTTIEGAFGSKLMTEGFLLNNELTDFEFVSHVCLPRDRSDSEGLNSGDPDKDSSKAADNADPLRANSAYAECQGDNIREVANSPEGGKRPRSSMAPTIVFDPNNRPFLVIGSAGGSRIIGFVAQRIIAAIDWDMEVQDALNMKSVVNRGKGMELEYGLENLVPGLRRYEHPVELDDMVSGLTAIQWKDGAIWGAADPRREGLALGR